MKKIIFILSILIFGHISAQDTITPSKEAKEFTLDVVKSYINKNCNQYVASFNDSVVMYVRKNDTLMSKENLTPFLNKICQNSTENEALTFEHYLNHYQLTYFDIESFSNIQIRGNQNSGSTFSTLKHYQYQEGDILFVGTIPKDSEAIRFKVNDGLSFIFRKINGTYKIVLFTN